MLIHMEQHIEHQLFISLHHIYPHTNTSYIIIVCSIYTLIHIIWHIDQPTYINTTCISSILYRNVEHTNMCKASSIKWGVADN